MGNGPETLEKADPIQDPAGNDPRTNSETTNSPETGNTPSDTERLTADLAAERLRTKQLQEEIATLKNQPGETEKNEPKEEPKAEEPKETESKEDTPRDPRVDALLRDQRVDRYCRNNNLQGMEDEIIKTLEKHPTLSDAQALAIVMEERESRRGEGGKTFNPPESDPTDPNEMSDDKLRAAAEAQVNRQTGV